MVDIKKIPVVSLPSSDDLGSKWWGTDGHSEDSMLTDEQLTPNTSSVSSDVAMQEALSYGELITASRRRQNIREAQASAPKVPEGSYTKVYEGLSYQGGAYVIVWASSTVRLTQSYNLRTFKWLEETVKLYPNQGSPEWKLVGTLRTHRIYETSEFYMRVTPSGSKRVDAIKDCEGLKHKAAYIPIELSQAMVHDYISPEDTACMQVNSYKKMKTPKANPAHTYSNADEVFQTFKELNISTGPPTKVTRPKEVNVPHSEETMKPFIEAIKSSTVEDKCGNIGPRCEYGQTNPCTLHRRGDTWETPRHVAAWTKAVIAGEAKPLNTICDVDYAAADYAGMEERAADRMYSAYIQNCKLESIRTPAYQSVSELKEAVASGVIPRPTLDTGRVSVSKPRSQLGDAQRMFNRGTVQSKLSHMRERLRSRLGNLFEAQGIEANVLSVGITASSLEVYYTGEVLKYPPRLTFVYPVVSDGDLFADLEDHVVRCAQLMYKG